MTPPPARPRILEMITLSDWGGAQAYVFAVARGFKDRYDIAVACAPGGPLIPRLHREGVRVIEIPSLVRTPSPLADLITVWRVVRCLRRERFDLVHCHSTKAGLLGRLAARIAAVPAVVFTAHGWPFTSGWHPIVRIVSTLAERAAAHLATTIICVAHHVRAEALRMRIGRPAQLAVIHNGVDPALWVERPAVGTSPGHSSPSCTVVMVGRLQDPKDPATLVRAWKRISGAHRLILVGDGPIRPELEAIITGDRLSDRVILLGAREDVPALLRDADIFVLSSRWEGLPLAVIEAMMAGLPVVATAVGGVSEVVADGQTGILVPPGQPEALAGALNRLLKDTGLRTQMGATGRQRALEHFTEARMLADIGRLYERILSRDGALEARVAV